MKKIFIFIILYLIPFVFISFNKEVKYFPVKIIGKVQKQQLNEDNGYIIWSKSRKLCWDDFQGVPVKSLMALGYGAGTYSILQTKIIKTYQDSIVMKITSIFVLDRSWKTEESPLLLDHEQRHFDITEIFSRRFREELSIYVSKNDETAIKYFKNLAYKYAKLADSMGDLYDSETKHGSEIESQKKWDEKIDSMLVKFKMYSSPHVVVMRK